MVLTVRYASEADAYALGQINIACFNHQELWDNAFPDIRDETLLPFKVARFLQNLADPDVHVVVVVETDAPGQPIIGYSCWTIPGDPSPLQLSSTAQELMKSSNLPEGAKKTVLNGYREKLYACRNQHWMKRDILLDFLATLPQYQRRGAASVLLRWGMEQAAERRVGIFLEATMDGYQLYRKRGWKDVYELTMNYDTWGGKGVQTLTLMRKAP